MDDKMSENVHDVHHKIYGKLESGISNRRTNSGRSKSPKERHSSTIRYGNNTAKLYIKKIERKLQIYRVAGKDKPPYVYGLYKGIHQERKITRNPYTNNKNIQPGYRNGILD